MLSDRNLSRKNIKYGKAYLDLCVNTISPFISDNNISFAFGEITWAFDQIVEMICSSMGVRCLQPTTVRIPSERFAFFESFLQRNLFEKTIKKNEGHISIKQYLYDFRKEKPQPEYLKLNNETPIIKPTMVISFFRHLLSSERDESTYTLWGLVNDKIKTILNIFTCRYMIDLCDNPNLDEEYFLITLHKQPESSIDVLGENYSNQYENIEKISRTVKNNTYVYVKEHSNAIGDRGFLWYKKIKKLPNVKLIDPYLNSFDLMKKAKAVISVTGTVCYEAALMGIPAFTFGDLFFGPVLAGNNINYDGLKEICGKSREDLIQMTKKDDYLIEFLTYIFKNSHEGIISDPDSNINCISDDNISKVVSGFLSVLSQGLRTSHD